MLSHSLYIIVNIASEEKIANHEGVAGECLNSWNLMVHVRVQG